LDAIKAKFPDVAIHTYNADFVATASTILKDIPPAAFAFFFVDPKGWRIDIQQLAPLLSRANSEVVFNFMFEFINRAASINDKVVIDGLTELMPHGDWRGKLGAQAANDPKARMAALAEAFRETLAKVGSYSFVASIPVLRPVKDRTIYSLFYGTRHAKGIEVFRDCHVKTERQQSTVRTATKRARDEAATGQQLLFGSDVQMGPQEIDAFFEGERLAAREALLQSAPVTPSSARWENLWPGVLAKHAVTRPEINKIAADLRKEGLLLFPDWGPKKRVPDDSYRLSRANGLR
jgi:hypothetical protein